MVRQDTVIKLFCFKESQRRFLRKVWFNNLWRGTDIPQCNLTMEQGDSEKTWMEVQGRQNEISPTIIKTLIPQVELGPLMTKSC